MRALVIIVVAAACSPHPMPPSDPVRPPPSDPVRPPPSDPVRPPPSDPVQRPASGVQEIAVGAGHACLRMADGAVYCWGSDEVGSIGVRGPSVLERFHAVPVRVPDVVARRLLLVGVATCVEDATHRLTCWGGLHGGRRSMLRATGRLVASGAIGCAISEAGEATCWGEDTNGRLSPGSSAASGDLFGKEVPPHRLALAGPVATVAFGDRHGCALGRDGRVRCWGLNNFGQLAAAGYWDRGRAEPAVVDRVADATELVAGSFHTCALERDGSVWCWGRADSGELGTGRGNLREGEYNPDPTRVAGLPPIDHIAASWSDTCAISRQGELWCWGGNEHGQVGDGSSENRAAPVRIAGLAHVVQVSVGDGATCALTADGDVSCWGDNEDGRLGNGSVEASALPVKVVLPGAAAEPPAAPAASATFESLACGFRFTARGKRIRATPEDEAVDTIELAPVGDTRIVARCAVRDRRVADPLGAIEHQLAARGGGPVQRRRVGAASCLAVDGPQRSLICLGPDHVITLTVQSSDASLASRVLDSLALFDRTAGFAAKPPKSSLPAPPGMIAIAAGELAMGCPNQSLFTKPVGELGCMEESQPLHRVRLSAYAIDRTEVTVGDYRACVAAGACSELAVPYLRGPEETHKPVRYVTWHQATAYCAWKHARLPTEAEWERAARGTDLRSRPWGDAPGTCRQAQLLTCGVGPIDVGKLPAGASPDGVLDMVGNVKEWVADGYARTYYIDSPPVDPKGPSSAVERVIRGSSYSNDAGSSDIYHRYGRAPSFQSDELGFRCAVSLPR